MSGISVGVRDESGARASGIKEAGTGCLSHSLIKMGRVNEKETIALSVLEEQKKKRELEVLDWPGLASLLISISLSIYG